MLINYIPEEKCKISFIFPPLLTQVTDLQSQGKNDKTGFITINEKINYNLIWVISTQIPPQKYIISGRQYLSIYNVTKGKFVADVRAAQNRSPVSVLCLVADMVE